MLVCRVVIVYRDDLPGNQGNYDAGALCVAHQATHGAGHTGSLTLNGTGLYTQTGTFGIGTLTLNGVKISTGVVTPNGAVVGGLGDIYLNKNGGAGVTLWVKEVGVGTNLGWVAK